jgi:hypothetical protein
MRQAKSGAGILGLVVNSSKILKGREEQGLGFMEAESD